MPDATELNKKTDYNVKITEIECKITSIAGLATTSALNTVENKIPNFSDLVKKQVKMQNYQTLRLNTSTHLIIICLEAKYFIQR